MSRPASPLTFLPASIRAVVEQNEGDGVPFRARTSYVHTTWAKTFSSLPELLIKPESLAEVEKVVRLARACRRRLCTFGAGHSPSDMTCTSAWLVSLDNLNKVLSVDPSSGLVVVQAGMRLYEIGPELDRWGLAMPNLGSIDEQSVAGVISTGTHGSSLRHGLVSENIAALNITTADGTTRSCSPDEDRHLFRAALLSLGALGIITEVTLRVVPAFSLAWDQTIDSDARIFDTWDSTLWTQAEFIRVWWQPYTRRAVVWKADKVPREDLESGRIRHRDPPRSYYEGHLGYFVYHNLLWLSRYCPRILPWVEWFTFGMQHGFRNGDATRITAVQPSRQALLMNCLYSQFVTEWAIPLRKGPEALRRLASWIGKLQPGDPGYVEHGIPVSNEGMWIHSPVEVRVSDATVRSSREQGNRPFLDPSREDGPVLYLNAVMYRPYLRDPPNNATSRYFDGFEYLMKELGGKVHWAKNFRVSREEVEAWYGKDLQEWRRVRDEADPDGMFVGPWHRRLVLADGAGSKPDLPAGALPLEEVESRHEPSRRGDEVRFVGEQRK